MNDEDSLGMEMSIFASGGQKSFFKKVSGLPKTFH